jgi:hypothetical protein
MQQLYAVESTRSRKGTATVLNVLKHHIIKIYGEVDV